MAHPPVIDVSALVDPGATHARKLQFRHSQVAGFPRKISADCRARGASQERYEVKDHVEADLPVGPRDHEQPFEKPLQGLDALAHGRGVGGETGKGRALVRFWHHCAPAPNLTSRSVSV